MYIYIQTYIYVCIYRSLYAMQGEVNIKIPMDKGIAGNVASTGVTANIVDAYENPMFNQVCMVI